MAVPRTPSQELKSRRICGLIILAWILLYKWPLPRVSDVNYVTRMITGSGNTGICYSVNPFTERNRVLGVLRDSCTRVPQYCQYPGPGGGLPNIVPGYPGTGTRWGTGYRYPGTPGCQANAG
eukprot:3810873-Rhodomonas_salina.2